MDWLFTNLTDAMSRGPGLAMVASFAWGMMSVLLSPCHLSSLPLVVGYLNSRGERRTAGGILVSSVFAAGILVSIGVVGAATSTLGRMLGDVGLIGRYVVALIFVLIGLQLMDLLRMPDWGFAVRPLRYRSTFVTAFALGILFGFALGPCTFAFLAPVLALAFQQSDTDVLSAMALLGSFGIGHTVVIAVTGGLASRVQRYLDWSNKTSAILWTKRSAGLLVAGGGIYAFYSL